MAKSFDIGDEVTFTVTFTNLAGATQDPDLVACRVREPDGTIVPLTPSRFSQGVWKATFGITEPGEHWVRFEGSGAVKAAEEQPFVVKEQMVAAA